MRILVTGAVRAVFADEHLDGVVHLAGVAEERDLPTEFTSHVITTAALLDAMVENRVPRLVYAGSNHAVGRTPRPAEGHGPVSDDVLPRPDTFYGVAKVAAEALLRLYVDRYSIDAVSCRVGSFLAQPTTTRNLEPGRRLGYEPQDEDEFEAAHVGGPFAGEEFYRPALDLA